MNAPPIISDNYKAENKSFLFSLHEERRFDKEALAELCRAINALCRTHKEDRTVACRINFIYGQVLQHLLYHFDPNDCSRIPGLPPDYGKKLQALEKAVTEYFQTEA